MNLPVFFSPCRVARWAILLSLGAIVSTWAGDYRDASLPTDERVEDLLKQMTVKEKIGQLRQRVMDVGSDKVVDKFLPEIRDGDVSSYIMMVEDPAFRNTVQRTAVEGSRLHIPLIFGADV